MRSTSRPNFAFETIDIIARQNSLQRIAGAFGDAVTRLGFTSSGLTGVPPQEPGADLLILMETAPDGFRDCYVDERMYPHDHLATHARTATQPFRFADAPYSPARSRERKRFMGMLRSYGVDKGLIVPLGGTARVPTNVWLAGEDPDLHDEAVQMIQLVTMFAASKARVLAQRRDDGNRPALTAREREVLAWAAQGKSAWEVGVILRIAKRTVEVHTLSAIRKLGAANKTQAVALALLSNIIEL